MLKSSGYDSDSYGHGCTCGVVEELPDLAVVVDGACTGSERLFALGCGLSDSGLRQQWDDEGMRPLVVVDICLRGRALDGKTLNASVGRRHGWSCNGSAGIIRLISMPS
jgi:hypothetical protein